MNPVSLDGVYRIKSPTVALAPDTDLLDTLLALRGITQEERELFLKPDFDAGFHDPFLLKNMAQVVDRILLAIERNEHILVYSDFDADGIPGAAVIHDFFTKINYPHVSYFRPDRHVEGFGIHAHVLDEFFINTPEQINDAHAKAEQIASLDIHADTRKSASLMITIDCGIADVESVARIRSMYKDLDIVITDHHLPGAELPDAFAIINPKLEGCAYPEKMLCGAGVIYKVVCAIIMKMKELSKSSEESLDVPNAYKQKIDLLGAGYEKWLLDLVGLATLSDMVPLRGENRLFAYYGLVVMRKTRRPGFLALAKTNNIDIRNITEDDIVFTFSPRINVASRLANAKIAFDLLTAQDFDTAMKLAKELNSINQKRKTLVAQISKQAHKMIHDRKIAQGGDQNIIVIGNPDWKPPVLGLVATSLSKTYSMPSFVWGRSDDGIYKGSVRSIEGVDIVAIMHKVPDGVFINRGGHAQSGGFSISPENIFELESHIEQAFKDIYMSKGHSGDVSGVSIEVDAEIPLARVNRSTIDTIHKLAPYGMDNPKPIFAFPKCKVLEVRKFGKEKEHLELICTDDSMYEIGGRTIKAIQFFFNEAQNALQFAEDNCPDTCTIIGHIEKNTFRGANEIRVRIVNVV